MRMSPITAPELSSSASGGMNSPGGESEVRGGSTWAQQGAVPSTRSRARCGAEPVGGVSMRIAQSSLSCVVLPNEHILNPADDEANRSRVYVVKGRSVGH